MMFTSRRSIAFLAPLTLLALAGCGVFEPVGTFFAQGYRNTVSYFNAYYNAERQFSAAEVEILEAERLRVRGVRTATTQSVAIPTTARAKLTAVIDKCSNILAFHSRSSLVDDALLLIGRSYSYLGEHVKAERKFSELLVQFPTSELALEAEIRLGVAISDQGRGEDAQLVLEPAMKKAADTGNDEMQAIALARLARISRDLGQLQQSIAFYARLRAVTGREEIAATALIEEAGVLLDEGKPEEALELVDGIHNVTDDPYFLYQAGLLSSAALSTSGRYAASISRLDLLLNDFRYRDRQGWIRLERARVLEDSADIPAAIEEYRLVDTTYARQEIGARAAFSLGHLYETSNVNYAAAKLSYERAAAVVGTPFAADARKRHQAMSRYFVLQERLRLADSMRTAAHSLASDSLRSESLQQRKDSLDAAYSSIVQDIGEWFYLDLQRRDSSIVWLLRSIAVGKSHAGTARCLFILADLAQVDSSGILERPDLYLRRIVDSFPTTAYAGAARSRLGLTEADSTDPALQLYVHAEEVLLRGEYDSAARSFENVSKIYPASTLSGKSTYAAGWVYEYHLTRLDSALVRYREVVAKYPRTPYALEAQKKLVSITPPSDTLTVPSRMRNDERPAQPPGAKKPGETVEEVPSSQNKGKIE
ncbi:MAG: hypothetical protein A2X67_03775 [Ignavibacteria bacterium GWA2_55_11]|nr:MAG: hypothetical protein A2X67_03775 [Ignavibacteria bacterium GWA2_55_11]OGU65312.1 MAG: hypothetical protein A3C56_09145 [Ignavibacteria bacterium RIFCSPHIGHO2_02_FULL_56_12]OGU73144.1 MAG: hypothetical protein A3G43_04250 [Ignavibacteria bacterium RIFCSPLOWO2_12_FULL_56_21]